jgi:Putative adhesin
VARWIVEEPSTIDFDGVVALRANIVAGTVSILPSDDRPTLQIGEISGQPLEVAHEAGMLTINHKSSGWDGVLKWLQNTRGRVTLTLTVPPDCPVTLNLVTASAVVTGMAGRLSVKTASGDVTLDGVTGSIDANTAAGDIEAQGLAGSVTFKSLSGNLALAGGSLDRLSAQSVTGKVTTDVDLRTKGHAQVSTVSGEVTMRLPETTSATVALNSLTGQVDAGFAQLTRQDRPMGKYITGTLGDGSASLSVNSVSGAITLLSRPAPG